MQIDLLFYSTKKRLSKKRYTNKKSNENCNLKKEIKEKLFSIFYLKIRNSIHIQKQKKSNQQKKGKVKKKVK